MDIEHTPLREPDGGTKAPTWTHRQATPKTGSHLVAARNGGLTWRPVFQPGAVGEGEATGGDIRVASA